MFLFAVAIFFFHSMYSCFSSVSSFSKPIRERQIAPVTQLIGYNEDQSSLCILKPSKSSSIYCSSESEVHQEINNFYNLKVPDKMDKDMHLMFVNGDGDEINSVKSASLKLSQNDNDPSVLVFVNKNKKCVNELFISTSTTSNGEKEAKFIKLLRNRAYLTAAAIRVIVSKGICPVITIHTPVDKDFYIERILKILPAGTPLKFVKSEKCRLSFGDEDFDAFARIVLSKDEVINSETFMSVFRLICQADQVASQKELLATDQKTFLENQVKTYYEKLVKMAQLLKEKGLTVEPILKEFFKVVHTKQYRDKFDQAAFNQLINDAEIATNNAADKTKEKLKTTQNDNKFMETIPQNKGVMRNLFSWGIFIGKYIVGLYGLKHIIFGLYSKFRR